MNDLVLAAPIWEFTAERFIEKINELDDAEDVNVWLNSPGGSVFAGWSIIGRLKARTGQFNVFVLGHAASMAFLFTAFADNAEALDVTKFMVHRATGYVRNETDQKILDEINDDLLSKLKKRIDNKIFKEVTGTSLDKMWKAEDRIDQWISAKDAKKIGLINKVNRVEPAKMKAFTDKFVAFYDFDEVTQGSETTEKLDPNLTGNSQGSEKPENSDVQGSTEKPNENINKSKTDKKMNKQEFKNTHPDLYAEVYGDGEKAGVKTEQNRAQSWLAFLEIDKENVIKAIKEGTDFTTAVQAEMMVKMTAKDEVDKTKKDAAGNIITESTDGKTPEQKNVDEFSATVKESINVKELAK